MRCFLTWMIATILNSCMIGCKRTSNNFMLFRAQEIKTSDDQEQESNAERGLDLYIVTHDKMFLQSNPNFVKELSAAIKSRHQPELNLVTLGSTIQVTKGKRLSSSSLSKKDHETSPTSLSKSSDSEDIKMQSPLHSPTKRVRLTSSSPASPMMVSPNPKVLSPEGRVTPKILFPDVDAAAEAALRSKSGDQAIIVKVAEQDSAMSNNKIIKSEDVFEFNGENISISRIIKPKEVESLLKKYLNSNDGKVSKKLSSDSTEEGLTVVEKDIHSLENVRIVPVVLQKNGERHDLVIKEQVAKKDSESYREINSEIAMGELFSEDSGFITTYATHSREGDSKEIYFHILMERAAGDLTKINVDRKVTHQDMIGIAESIDRMHQKGIGHFDIKGENIFFFEGNNRLAIGDFGSSHFFKEFNKDTAMTYGPAESVTNKAYIDVVGYTMAFLQTRVRDKTTTDALMSTLRGESAPDTPIYTYIIDMNKLKKFVEEDPAVRKTQILNKQLELNDQDFEFLKFITKDIWENQSSFDRPMKNISSYLQHQLKTKQSN